MMTPQHRQELLSRAYVYAVAGHAGMTCATPNPDYGIDLTLHEVRVRIRQRDGRKRFGASGRALDIQLKSTAREVCTGDELIFELDVDSYNCLREAATPRILVVHLQPSEERSRLETTNEGLLLRGHCYWIGLQGYPEVPSERTTRIRIPKRNVFCTEQLNEIMRRIRMEESL